MKHVLVIGNSKSIWIKEYVNNIHYAFGNKVYLTDYYGLSPSEKQYYESLGAIILDVHHPNKAIRMVKCCFVLLRFAKQNAGQIDLLDIQSPPHSIQSMILSKLINILKTKTITTFWGSDILRLTYTEAQYLITILDKSDCINIGTKQMQQAFNQFFGEKYNNKCVRVLFGSPAIDYIRKCKESSETCKDLLGLDSSKITLAIGYNGNKEQQHLKVIEALANISKEEKKALQIIIHTSGSIDEEYLNTIVNAMINSDICYKVLNDSYDLETIARLRIATDIIIHAQITDGFSGSIRESVFAGAVLMNPSWINYDRFDNDGVDYIKYSSFEEIPQAVEKLLSGRIAINTENNKNLVYKEYSWEAVREKWAEIFDA